MRYKILFLINFIVILSANAETIYKTVDEDGNIVFSDIFSAGAEEIELKEAQSITLPPSPSIDYKPIEQKKSAHQYTQLQIISPEDNATIHSDEDHVNINIKIEPALNEKDLIVLLLDDQQVKTGKGTTFSLSNIDRGTHTIAIAIKNAKNKIIQRSAKHTFHVKKQSRLFPNSPTNPATAKKNNPATPAPISRP